jgi:hypothetical protein
MKGVFLVLAAAGALSSCAPQPKCWRGGIPLRPVEAQAWQAAVADIGKVSKPRVYRGLAHPVAAARRYRQQVAAGGWVEIEGFKFFAEPVAVEDGTVAGVLDLYRQASSHQAWGPKETCAGFHPDYAVVWTGAGGRRVLQLCYGCHEWKFIGPGGTVLTDISETAFDGPLTRRWLTPPQQ